MTDEFGTSGVKDAAASFLDQKRSSALAQLTQEVAVWAVKEQIRMEQELLWLRALQLTTGLMSVQAETNKALLGDLASKVDSFYGELG